MSAATVASPIAGGPANSSSEHQAAEEAWVHSTLHETYRIALHDGRVFEGQLSCFDNSGNIILNHAYRLLGAKDSTMTPTSAAADDTASDAATITRAVSASATADIAAATTSPAALTQTITGEFAEQRRVGMILVAQRHIAAIFLKNGDAA